MALLRRAKCITERLLKKMVADMATVTYSMRWFLKICASSGPAAANPTVRRRLAPTLIQNKLLIRK